MAALNEFTVLIVRHSGVREQCNVLAQSGSDAITQVMDAYPDALRIGARLASAQLHTRCAELGVCQGDNRCGCVPAAPAPGAAVMAAVPAPWPRAWPRLLQWLVGRA